MTKEACFELVKQIAPKHGLDVWIVQAICEQESNYDETAFRLENGFAHWLKKQLPDLSIPEIVLRSTSYGLMQMLGQSLLESAYVSPVGNLPLQETLDWYIDTPSAQIDSGCQWLTKKLASVGGDMAKGIARYNGTGSQAEAYAKSVLARAERLKMELA